eukprot:TRINITY_DN2585_c1_g1_i1.p1 TRINITY_DN2585_c1_g1~~TRINITY_DN2585_c1_g1_i1.p1  ORF type:complete len:1175 (+),score=163.86 TRINITY_DN2585_c1_g1_i1:92-3526(+)
MADDTDSMEADKSLHIPRPKRNLIKKSIKVSRSYRTLNPNMESSNEPDPLDRIAKLESKFHLHFHTPNDIKKPSDIIQSLDSTPLPKIRVKLPAISSSKQVTRNDTCVKVYRDISYRLESLDTVEKVTEEKLQSELFGAIYSPSPSSPPYPITIEELRRVNESISVTPGTFIKHDVFKSIPPEFYLKQNEDTLFASLLKNPKENKRMGARSLGPPSGRNDAIALLSWLNTIFDKLNKEPLKELERYELAQTVYYIAFAEVIRQVSVHCLERGLLMRKLWQSYVSLIEHLSGEYNEKRKKQKRKHEKRIEQIHTFYEKDIEDTRKDALKAKSEMEEKVQENAELKEVIEKQLEQLTEYGEKLEEERYKGLAVLQQYEAIKEKYEDVIEENRKLNVELKEMKESEDFYRVRSIEMIKENKAKEELRKAKVYKESEAQTEQTLIIEENVQAENINAKAKCVLSANNKVGVISIEKKTKKGKKKKGLRKKPAIISDATQTKQANYWGIVYEAAELDLAWEKDIKEEKVEVMEDTVPKDITRKNIVRSFSIQPSKGVRKMVVRENPLVKQKTMEEAPIKPSALREVQRVIHEEVHENLKDKAELVHNPQRELFAEYKKEPDLATEKVDDSSHYTRDNLVQEPDRTLEVGTITENDEVINAEILEMPAKENNDEPSIKENDNSQSEVQIEYKSEIKAEKEQSPLKVQNNGEMEKIEVDSGKKFNTKSDSPKSKPIAVQPKYTLKDHSQAQAPLEKQKKTQSKDTKKKIKISPTKPTHILETNEKDNVKLDKSNLPGEILKRVKPANANTSNNKKSQRVDYPQRLPTQQIMRESSEKKINKLTKPPANPPILNQPPPQTTVPVKPYAEKAFTVETELQKPVECKQKHQVPIEIQPSVATHSFNTSGVDKTQPINISKPTLQAPESVVNENRTASSPPPFQSDTLIEKNKALEQENSELRDKLVNLLTKFQQVQDDSASLGRIMHKLGDTHEKGEFQKLVENAKQLAQKNSESLRFEHRERRHRVKEDNSSKTAEKLRIMAQTENCKVEPLPKKMLLKTITTYYNECISGKTIQSLSGYVYSDLQNRFGLKTVADRKFLQVYFCSVQTPNRQQMDAQGIMEAYEQSSLAGFQGYLIIFQQKTLRTSQRPWST